MPKSTSAPPRPTSGRSVWPSGGYIRHGKRGDTYVIDRWMHGVHWHISTRCRTLRAAMKHLEAFESDPAGYAEHGLNVAPDALHITPELVDEFLRWKAPHVSVRFLDSYEIHLGAWMEKLHRLDLRGLRAADIKQRLGPRQLRMRIVALKAFCRWLREEKGLLTTAEDPSIDVALPPPAGPEKAKRRKAVPFEHVERVLAVLPGLSQDMLRVMAATGIHYSEMRRFATVGEMFEPMPQFRKAGALAMLAVKHKSSELHVVALKDARAVEAARRIREAGKGIPPESTFYRAVHSACRTAGVPVFSPGVMRHSVATWLAEAGVPLAAISDFLGHRSPTTTRRFYRDLGGQAVPLDVPQPRAVVLRALR